MLTTSLEEMEHYALCNVGCDLQRIRSHLSVNKCAREGMESYYELWARDQIERPKHLRALGDSVRALSAVWLSRMYRGVMADIVRQRKFVAVFHDQLIWQAEKNTLLQPQGSAPFEWEFGEETPTDEKMVRVFEGVHPSPRGVPVPPTPATHSTEDEGLRDHLKFLVMNGQSVLLHGAAGTGKTYWARDVVECMEDADKSVKVIAPTHAAALNAAGDEGATFHRYLCSTGGPFAVPSSFVRPRSDLGR